MTQSPGSLGATQQSGNVGGQSQGLQVNQGTKGSIQLILASKPEVAIRLTDLQPIGTGTGTGDSSQDDGGQGNNQTDPQSGSQGDGQDGQGSSSDSGTGSDQPGAQGDGSSDQGINPSDGLSGQKDNNGPCPSSATGQQTNAPSSPPGDPQGSQGNRTGDNQPSSLDNGQDGVVNNGLAPSSSGKTTGNSGGTPSDNANGAALGTGDGLNSAIASGSTGDKRQHGVSSTSVPDGEQRGLVSVADGKQHGPDGTFVPGDEIHSLIAPGSQDLDPHRSQAGVQSPLQHGVPEDPGQRQDRWVYGESSRRPALAEAPYTPTEEVYTPFLSDLAADALRDNDQPGLAPQHHGLLTDSLSLDFGSLRAEVRRFFAEIENLGPGATDRRLSMVLCSGAAVVAAAMACEVARRQARRAVSSPAIAHGRQPDLENESDDPSDIGLPNFAQFSTF